MFFKRPLKLFLFPTVNIILAFFLLSAFFIAGRSVLQTIPFAYISASNYLSPRPMDYFWEVNINQAPIDRDQIRYYRDYYEYLLQVFPSLRDAYGILGYCYYYLGDDARAIDYLEKAIASNPIYPWNYYNLAAMDINKSRYQEAAALLQKLQLLDPQKSLERMFASQFVYAPLLQAGGKDSIGATARHLKILYKASFDLLRILNQMAYRKDLEGLIKKVKLVPYAF